MTISTTLETMIAITEGRLVIGGLWAWVAFGLFCGLLVFIGKMWGNNR